MNFYFRPFRPLAYAVGGAMALLCLAACNRFKKEDVVPANATYVRLINLDNASRVRDAHEVTSFSGNIIFNYNGLIDGLSLDSSRFTTQFNSINGGSGGNLGNSYKPNGLIYLSSAALNYFSYDENAINSISDHINFNFCRNNIDLVYQFPGTSGIYRSQTRDPLDDSYINFTTGEQGSGAVNTRSYFPNAENRVPVGPILGGISFHKWAALSSGLINVRINQANFINTVSPEQAYAGTKVLGGPLLLQEQRQFSQGEFTTLLFGRSGTTPTLVALHEPSNASFKPGFAYLRFVNLSNTAGTPGNIAEYAKAIDVYLAPLADSGQAPQPEQLVSSNLQPFVSPESLPYVGIDFTRVAGLTKTDSLPYKLQAYQARIYPSGQSAANGNTPIAILPLNRFVIPTFLPKGYYQPYNPLVAWTKGSVQPLVRTFCLRLFQTILNLPSGITPGPASIDGQSLPAGVEAITYDLEPASATDYYYH